MGQWACNQVFLITKMTPLGEHRASVSTNLAGRRSSSRGGCKTRNIAVTPPAITH